MPRSLEQAGVNVVPLFVKVEYIIGQPFYITTASLRQSRFGHEEVVFQLRLRDGVFDFEGELHKRVWLSLAAGDQGQRRDMAKYFLNNNDPLGPCMIEEIPTDKGNPFYRINDVEDVKLVAPADPYQLPERVANGQMAMDDIPF